MIIGGDMAMDAVMAMGMVVAIVTAMENGLWTLSTARPSTSKQNGQLKVVDGLE